MPAMSAPSAGLLRFVTCGSVDDGKSTLIGRLLCDAGLIPGDELARLRPRAEQGGGHEIDYAWLLDGLQAEREQHITIDVAYRYFSTDRRRFIVADAPGHEQYTRNMATGASASDAAVVLVDAREGLLVQTLRHSHIASLFGIRHVVLAVNKMDLVGYSEDRFRETASAYRAAVERLGFASIDCIPVSALHGHNLAQTTDAMPWYEGPALLPCLEGLSVSSQPASSAFRFPVQWVNRPHAGFRGYCGTVASGKVRPGDEVVISPSGDANRVSRIVTMDGEQDLAVAGDAVTLLLDVETDVGRGNVIGSADSPPEVSDQFRATLLWMDAEPMLPGRAYEMKIGTQSTIASISDLRYVLDVSLFERKAAKVLELNGIGVCNLALSQAVAYDSRQADGAAGSRYILIDRYSKRTVGAGAIDYGLSRALNLAPQNLQVDKAARAGLKNQKPCVLWFTGLSGAGKSTIADLTEKKLHTLGLHTHVLDGDNVRAGLGRDLGFTDADRVENIRRISEVAGLFVEAGLIVLVAVISPFRSEREMARSVVDEQEFLEIFVDTPVSVCESRDPKGLYRKARRGELSNFTGIDSPYEPPEEPELRIDTTEVSAEEAADQVVRLLRARGSV